MKINGIIEHASSLGKGEVVSSILPGSTRKAPQHQDLSRQSTPLSPPRAAGRKPDAGAMLRQGGASGNSVPTGATHAALNSQSGGYWIARSSRAMATMESQRPESERQGLRTPATPEMSRWGSPQT
jgi:hypothetical protein